MLRQFLTRAFSSLRRRLSALTAGFVLLLALVIALSALVLPDAGQLRQRIAELALLCGLGLAGLGWFAAHWFAAPLTRLAAAVRAGGQTDETAAVPVPAAAPDEIAALAEAFASLNALAVRQRHDLETLETVREDQATERAVIAERRVQELNDEIAIRQQVEDALVENRDTFGRIIEAMLDGIAISVNGEIMYANQTLLNIFGYSRNDILGLAEDLLISPEARERYYKSLDSTFFEIEGVYIDGGVFPIEVFKRPINYYGQQGRLLFVRDITQRKQDENEMKRLHRVTSEQLVELQQVYHQLSFQAAHDHLTGLANRKQFDELLERLLAKPPERPVSLLYIDLDRFKLVNDTLGHAAGDDLLRQVAQRLRACAPASGTLARLGGDEFALLLPQIAALDEPIAIARAMLAALQQPFQLGATSIVITSSIGIGFYPADAQTLHQFLQKTDAALYEAKALGRNNYHLASDVVEKDLALQVRLERDLHGAIERGEFRLEYQPQYSLLTGTITGFEALLRWQHPELGLISPTDFIPIAEDTGLILPIGQWVLAEACRAVASWQAVRAGVTVAVNVSTLQAEQAEFAAQVLDTLQAQGVAPALVDLEITESMLMHERDIGTLRTLCDTGMRFALDDFGTGYSSLLYLQRLPVSILKIDRSFVFELRPDKPSALVNAMITMAHSLNMQVIAEGVENHTQLELLTALKCDVIQGFIVSRSLPVDAVIPFLESFTGVPAP